MQGDILISLAAIGVLGIACQWLAWMARLPSIMFLLVCGLVIGPITGMLDPDLLFGELLFPLVSLSVAVILFEGSLTLKIDEIRELRSVVRNLISVGALITWGVTAAATHYLLGFDFQIAFLFGAVVVVTGPTVIIPMLRTIRPNANISNILRWEGIVIDPLGALLAVLVFDFIISSQKENAIGSIFLIFGNIVLVGTTIGAISALALGFVLKRHLIPEYLRNVLSLTLVFGVYAIADVVEHESGLLAVTIMGMTLANMKDLDIDDILDFKESLSVLLISGLFIVLAARIDIFQLIAIGWPALLVLAAVMFIARPLAVFVSTLGSDLNFKERLMIAWIGPRGIVCAAVAALFAIRLEEAGYPEAQLLVPLAFMVIIGTVLIQSATAKYLAQWLGVREPPPTGLLIIGAGNVARTTGKALQDIGFKVILTDSNWENTSRARMEGLDAYYGNPISEHADRNLDLVGIGKMLAMSGRVNLDILATLRFRPEFGSNNVFEVATTRDQLITDKHKISTRHHGAQLFGEEVTHGILATWIRNGAKIRSTQLSEEFDFEAYCKKYGEHCIPLFAIDAKERLQFFTAENELKPESTWTIVSLVNEEFTDETV
jgi:CPA1 family monovalent cation:H+ antiporter